MESTPVNFQNGALTALNCHARAFGITTGILSVAVCSGCSINGMGLIAGRINAGDGAITYSTFAPGINVRTGKDDRGLSVGMSRRLCLAEATAQSPAPGWYFFVLPTFPSPCFARDMITVGTELRMTPLGLSVALGARMTTILAQVPMADSADYELRYDHSDLNSAFLRLPLHGESQ